MGLNININSYKMVADRSENGFKGYHIMVNNHGMWYHTVSGCGQVNKVTTVWKVKGSSSIPTGRFGDAWEYSGAGLVTVLTY